MGVNACYKLLLFHGGVFGPVTEVIRKILRPSHPLFAPAALPAIPDLSRVSTDSTDFLLAFWR